MLMETEILTEKGTLIKTFSGLYGDVSHFRKEKYHLCTKYKNTLVIPPFLDYNRSTPRFGILVFCIDYNNVFVKLISETTRKRCKISFSVFN